MNGKQLIVIGICGILLSTVIFGVYQLGYNNGISQSNNKYQEGYNAGVLNANNPLAQERVGHAVYDQGYQAGLKAAQNNSINGTG